MNSKLFAKYIRNYFGVLMVVLILLIPIYVSIYKGTEKLILNQTYNMLERGIMDLDSRITKMTLITDVLRSNRDVKKVAEIEGEPVVSDVMVMNNAKAFLTSCLTLGIEESREYLIFKENSLILTTGELLSDPFYHDYSQYSQMDMEFESFKSYIFSDDKTKLFLPRIEDEENVGIVCIIKGSGKDEFFYNMALIFEIRQDIFSQILGIDKNSQTDFAYLTDGDGNLLYQMNYLGDLLSEDIDQGQKIEYDGEQYTILKVQAPDSGLKCIVGISNKTIGQGINNINQIIWIYIIIAMLIMIAFCVYFAIQRARSIHGIMYSLRYAEDRDGKIKNEFQYITREISSLYEENDGYRLKIESMQKSIFNSMLERLLQTGVYSAQEKAEVQSYLDWKYEFYCIVIVGNRSDRDKGILNSFYYIDEFFESQFSCISVSIGKNERTYIVQMKPFHIPDTSAVAEVLKELLVHQQEIIIGISGIGTGLENIQLCYRQARLVVRQLRDLYDENIARYCEQIDVKDKIFRLNLGNRIYDLIFSIEKNTLKELFEKIREYAAKSVWSNEQEIMQFFFEIQNPIARVWDEVDRSHAEKRSFPEYQSSKTMFELIDELEQITMYLCDCIVYNKEKNKKTFYNNMVQFVDSHYMEKEMCVAYVAEHLGISDKYFITLFKEYTGQNFGVYVENKRMCQVEKYLLETDWSMGKIADMVGYNTIDTFYKSFKKIYGIAPGKWKENRKRR